MNTIYWLAWLGSRSFFAAGGLQVVNREKCIGSGGAIIAANHASYLDPPLVASTYPTETAFMARSTLFKGFGAWLYPRLNAFPIDRDHADLKSVRLILRKLQSGQRVLVFPEGTRTRDGKLQEGKAGLGMLVAKSGVPVQPVRIVGSYQAWPRGGKFRYHPLKIIIGDPVRISEDDLRGKSREAYQRIADHLMQAIADLAPEES